MNGPRLRNRLKENFPGRLLLGALSGLYGLGVALHRSLFRLGLLKRHRLPIRTLCIGNLTAGGTGKTPAVLLAVSELAGKKLRPAVLTRGYRRPGRGPKVLVLADGAPEASWRVSGDEPWMLRQAFQGQGVPILVSPDRYAAGKLALERFPLDVLILDDGFQHWGLKRDLDIVLLDAANPFGGGSLLPLGTLRESARGLRRAGLILLTRVDRSTPEGLESLRGVLEKLAPSIPVAEAIHRAEFLLDVRAKQRLPLSRLKGKRVAALSGIGDPESFEAELVRLGAELAQRWRYPDHHPYTLIEMRSLDNALGDRAVVTTLKDLPRLPEGWEETLRGDILALGVRLEIVKGREDWERCLFKG